MNGLERVRNELTRLTLFALLMYTVGARAVEPDTPMFSFSGFGTGGLVYSSEDQADFTSSIIKPDGAGYTHTWSPDVDSLIAGQVTANFTEKLSGVVQVISEQDEDDSYKPDWEWLNLKYQFTPDFSVRVGRTVLPAFLLSDTRKVGYTYPWVRPPLEVYRLLPLTNSDGVDVSYRLHFGELANNVQVNVGQNDSADTKARNSWGISNTSEYGPLTTRITYQRTDLTVSPLNALFNGFRRFGSQGAMIADKYDVDAKPLRFLGIGASYDPGNWFLMSEWGYIDTDSSIGESTAWYVSGGYPLGKFTPYVTYARADADNLSDPGLDVSGVPPEDVGDAIGLNAALNSFLSTKTVQNTVSIGARWDFMKNTALKLQFDHTNIGAGSSGVLRNLQPDFQPGGNVNVVSATVDFVF